MSHTIHGKSHSALRFMRKKPAALPVYWIYISRTNHDNVAWPSLRGLSIDTDWSINSCKDARDWLVEHQALELVEGYLRPEWKKLDAAERTLKLSLDRSEYYKPTGKLVIEDKTFSMLYFGADEPTEEPIATNPNDVSPDDTSLPCITPCDVAPDDTELSNKVLELDSSKRLPAPEKGAGEVFNPPDQKTPKAKKLPKPKAWADVDQTTLGEMIKTWVDNQVKPPVESPYSNGRIRTQVAALIRAGFTSSDIARYMVALRRQETYWKDKPITMDRIVGYMPSWLATNPAITIVQQQTQANRMSQQRAAMKAARGE